MLEKEKPLTRQGVPLSQDAESPSSREHSVHSFQAASATAGASMRQALPCGRDVAPIRLANKKGQPDGLTFF